MSNNENNSQSEEYEKPIQFKLSADFANKIPLNIRTILLDAVSPKLKTMTGLMKLSSISKNPPDFKEVPLSLVKIQENIVQSDKSILMNFRKLNNIKTAERQLREKQDAQLEESNLPVDIETESATRTLRKGLYEKCFNVALHVATWYTIFYALVIWIISIF